MNKLVPILTLLLGSSLLQGCMTTHLWQSVLDDGPQGSLQLGLRALERIAPSEGVPSRLGAHFTVQMGALYPDVPHVQKPGLGWMRLSSEKPDKIALQILSRSDLSKYELLLARDHKSARLILEGRLAGCVIRLPDGRRYSSMVSPVNDKTPEFLRPLLITVAEHKWLEERENGPQAMPTAVAWVDARGSPIEDLTELERVAKGTSAEATYRSTMNSTYLLARTETAVGTNWFMVSAEAVWLASHGSVTVDGHGVRWTHESNWNVHFDDHRPGEFLQSLTGPPLGTARVEPVSAGQFWVAALLTPLTVALDTATGLAQLLFNRWLHH